MNVVSKTGGKWVLYEAVVRVAVLMVWELKLFETAAVEKEVVAEH